MEQEVPVNTSYSLETCLEQFRASECEEAEQAQVESPFQEREGWNPTPPTPCLGCEGGTGLPTPMYLGSEDSLSIAWYQHPA